MSVCTSHLFVPDQQVLVLASDSQNKGINAPFLKSLAMDQEKYEASRWFFLVEISVSVPPSGVYFNFLPATVPKRVHKWYRLFTCQMSFPWLSPNQQHQSQWSGFILCITSFLWRATLPVHWLSSAKTFIRLLLMTFSSVYLFCIDPILISNEQKTTIPHCYLQIAPCCQHQHQQLEALHPHLIFRHHCQSQPECFDSLSSTRQIHHYSEYTITITN